MTCNKTELLSAFGWTDAINQTGHDGFSPVRFDEGCYNYSRQEQEYFEMYRQSVPISLLFATSYVLVFLVGLAGNSMVIYLVIREPKLKTVPDLFILNLALADCLVLIVCMPSNLISSILIPWILGRAMCKMVTYVQGVSVAASVHSLVAVSVDRFMAICFPLRVQISKQKAGIIIINIWIFSILLTLPWALYFDLIHFEGYPDVLMCIEIWPEGQNGKLYFLVAHFLLCYIFPLIMISVCYTCIWAKVWYRKIPGESTDEQVERMQQKLKFKMAKMLMVVVVFFMLSWLPLYTIFTRINFFGDLSPQEQDVLSIALPIAQWLGSANSCVNPILYAFFNAKYRRGFVSIIRSCQCCGPILHMDDGDTSDYRRSSKGTFLGHPDRFCTRRYGNRTISRNNCRSSSLPTDRLLEKHLRSMKYIEASARTSAPKERM